MNCHLQAPTSAKQGKHRRTHDKMHKILLPRNVTYKEGPQIRGNGRATQDAPEDIAQGPPVSHPEEGGPEAAPCGVGQPSGSAEPGHAYVRGAAQRGVAPTHPYPGEIRFPY